MVKWLDDITQAHTDAPAQTRGASQGFDGASQAPSAEPLQMQDAREFVTRDEIAQLFAKDLGYTAR